MGSADIYDVVERLPEITEALVIGAEQPDGGYWMPLFVVLADGADLTDALANASATPSAPTSHPATSPTRSSPPRAFPHTRTGKKLEVPIKRLFQGADADRVVEPSAVDNPDLLSWYAGVKVPGAGK